MKSTTKRKSAHAKRVAMPSLPPMPPPPSRLERARDEIMSLLCIVEVCERVAEASEDSSMRGALDDVVGRLSDLHDEIGYAIEDGLIAKEQAPSAAAEE